MLANVARLCATRLAYLRAPSRQRLASLPGVAATILMQPIKREAFALPRGAAALIAAGSVGLAILQADNATCEPAASPTPTYLTANFIADAAAKASPALVNIRVGPSSGSGFVVDPNGTILTNTHVVRDAMRRGASVSVTLSDGVTQLQGVVQHADAESDIAIVRVRSSLPLPSVVLGSSGNLRPGEFVVALGAPAGLSNSVSAGIISAVSRTRSDLGMRERRGTRASAMEYLQTDAAINSGNSGGPLLNLAGEVIGVNTMKAMGMDGIAFAVPIDDVKRVVSQLLSHGRVLRPYLGLKFVELDPQIARQLERSRGDSWQQRPAASLPSAGLYVMHVTPDSPAQRAGVHVGDTIVGMDASGVRTTKELIDGLANKVNQQVELQMLRGGQRVSASCRVESMQQ
jgi:HtrA serine peptidase 2